MGKSNSSGRDSQGADLGHWGRLQGGDEKRKLSVKICKMGKKILLKDTNTCNKENHGALKETF